MSLYLGSNVISGTATNTKSNAHSLLDFKWSDHILNEMSWLRADTFSWQSGLLYVAAYQHLTTDYANGASKTETVGGYTITYVEATDGHKITTDEANVINIYNATGVAWFYVIDTANQRFKLPRTKYGFTGLRDSAGKYVEAGLPQLDGWTAYGCNPGIGGNEGVFYENQSVTSGYGGSGQYNYTRAHFKASMYNSIYGNSSTVQPPATQMYLYFYVGEFDQTATEQTAGLNSSLFNGKVDLDGHNATFAHIVETYSNGTSWYRIWSDGWCEQGGLIERPASNYTATIYLLKPYRDTNWEYSDSMQLYAATGFAWNVEHESSSITDKTTSSFSRTCGYGASYSWQAKGYIS